MKGGDIEIGVKVELSFWDALKLRIAGITGIAIKDKAKEKARSSIQSHGE